MMGQRRGCKGPEWNLDGPDCGFSASSCPAGLGGPCWVLSIPVSSPPLPHIQLSHPSFRRPRRGAVVWWSYGESLRMDRAEEGQTHSTPWVPESCCPCTSLPQPSVILSPGQLMTSPLPTAPRGPCVLPSGPRWFSVLWLHLHAQPGGLSLGTRAVSAPRRVRLAIRWDHPHPGLVWSRKEPRLQHHRAQMLGRREPLDLPHSSAP